MQLMTMTTAAAFSYSKSCRCRHRCRSHLLTPTIIGRRRVSTLGNNYQSSHHNGQQPLFATVLDDSMLLFNLETDPTTVTTTTISPSSSYGLTPIPEFEPILNVEATSSFLIIVVIFSLLQLRIYAISNAAQRRSNALIALRKIESKLLSGDETNKQSSWKSSSSSSSGSFEYKNTNNVVVDKENREKEELMVSFSSDIEKTLSAAKKEYEDALRAEIQLRNIAPGIRIIAPDDPRRDEENRAAAKRLLGWSSQEFGDTDDTVWNAAGKMSLTGRLEGKEGRGTVRPESGSGNADDGNGLSNGAKILLVGVASMLLVLLYTLSFDPMVMQ